MQDVFRRKGLIRRRLPLDGPDAIDTQQAGSAGGQPEISVRRLCDALNRSFGETIAIFPRGMPILADIQRGIQRERAGARQHPRQNWASQLHAVPSPALRAVVFAYATAP